MTNTTIHSDQDKAVVQPARDLVAAFLPDLRSQLQAAVAAGVRELVLDFTRVQMIDSAGIGLVIAAHNSLRKAGGRLAITGASAEVANLLRCMRVHQHLSVNQSSGEPA